jgi:hypothetical protein
LVQMHCLELELRERIEHRPCGSCVQCLQPARVKNNLALGEKCTATRGTPITRKSGWAIIISLVFIFRGGLINKLSDRLNKKS